ncbi:aromatic ring-hydroxylating oxygenase subunit alpha [Roseovarius pelagicus]|uniref:Aromatic ring-hydroxylating dioxygenase subunit alpha n=1 Tax=Roseovarius pelagicus TaxID=2980108 RepID=A0ABY6DE19_9RHOB|nr:aromatic ring-hydroxylating dioxygenase subunit alpha [Roseovarius pelagicus]UXX83463.1 aromatic ring-hydroxylating dioxygenase subunit alpha [Roseovarius pelagicus]
MNVDLPPNSPLLDRCPEALPARAYYDADWCTRECAAIWARQWVYAGRHDQQPINTLRRIEIAGQSVVLARGGDGMLRAFHNTCRHRGAALCQAEQEAYNGKLIKCPYHAWAYDAAGRLVSTGYATPTADFDKSAHGLFPVHLKLWNGFVFLCLADTPPDFTPDIGLDALDNWPMANLVVGHVLEKDMACNWKVFWENYNECLHCPGIHPELSDLVPVYRSGIMSAEERARVAAGETAQPALKPGARSWTQTGAACGPEFPDLTEEERQRGHTFVTLYPTMYIVGHVDYVRAVTLTPLGPETTRLRAEWLFAPKTLAQPGFDLEGVTRFANTVLMQDGAACEMNQRGLHCSKFNAGRLMPQEFAIYDFHQWVREQMERA